MSTGKKNFDYFLEVTDNPMSAVGWVLGIRSWALLLGREIQTTQMPNAQDLMPKLYQFKVVFL